MGKSPGKWIKNVLFGNKHSKSRPSKSITPDKRVSLRETTEDQVGNSLDVSAPHELTENGAPFLNGTTADLCNTTASDGTQGQESQVVCSPLSDVEMLRQNQSAAKVQAALRGYLARRAFHALKGIIRLQALIRGHMVRRQAVATMYYMQAIVKLQAAVRGWNVGRLSTTEKKQQKYDVRELQVNFGEKSVLNYRNVATNSFIRKLLSSVPNPMPLTLQFDEADSNSASAWLDRWTYSHFWAPVHPKKVSSVKAHRKLGQQIVENEFVKSRRTSRRAENSQNGDNGVSAPLEIDVKRYLKKGFNHQAELVQEPHQNELERVKRSLRKISATGATASEKVEIIVEKQQPVVKTDSQPENTAIDAEEFVTSKANGIEADQADVFPPAVTDSPESKPEEIEEISVPENPKVGDMTPHLDKPEFNDCPSQNTPPSLPSYMAATASAKAKLRASGSSKHGELTGHIRRHSLPTPANGKSTSLSPGIQQSNGKATHKSNKSTASSRDGWKR